MNDRISILNLLGHSPPPCFREPGGLAPARMISFAESLPSGPAPFTDFGARHGMATLPTGRNGPH
ncbi:hypothetical protein [Marinimicrococcus flavescens]|uniref:Uncharacterized protein n=1 Tax=Marinimicrococcus flavescens TaxID=3031815 RepID=A0AAP3UYK6_9PROT|nr:hypothetical protein [Marinimicrococcus flavescens]